MSEKQTTICPRCNGRGDRPDGTCWMCEPRITTRKQRTRIRMAIVEVEGSASDVGNALDQLFFGRSANPSREELLEIALHDLSRPIPTTKGMDPKARCLRLHAELEARISLAKKALEHHV